MVQGLDADMAGRIVKNLKRIFSQELTDQPSPAPCLDFPSMIPHTPCIQAPKILKWSDNELEDTAGIHHRIGRSGTAATQRVPDNENRILRHQVAGRLRLIDGERKALAEIGKKLGKQALEEVASLVKPDTMLAWYRQLIAQKFDGSPQRKALGRPKIDQELEALVVRMAQQNRRWGYDRIAGALAHLGYTISDQDRRQYSQALWDSPCVRAQQDDNLA